MGSYNEPDMKTAYLPFKMGYLTDDMQAKAERELGETDEVKKEALAQMRILLKEEPKLHCPDDDAYLLQFLRARKFNTKKAFALLQNFYHVKKSYSDLYKEPDLLGLRKNVKEKLINALPYRDEEGCPIVIAQLYRWNPDEMKFGTFVHAFTGSFLQCIEDPATQVCGVKVIMDVNGVSMKHVRNVAPRFLHLFARALRNCLPIRFKAVHIYNESYIFQYFWSIIKMLLSDKIKNRIHFHSDSQKSLHEQISPALLPTEYGGTLNYDHRFWVKDMAEFEERYCEIHTYGYKSKKLSTEE